MVPFVISKFVIPHALNGNLASGKIKIRMNTFAARNVIRAAEEEEVYCE
jgi:hypothetical protein